MEKPSRQNVIVSSIFTNPVLASTSNGKIEGEIEASRQDTAAETIPDGGYGWIVVLACFIQTFWINAWTGSWGILQVALLQTTLKGTPTSTISFVGSLGLSLPLALGLFSVRVARVIGARWTTLIGIFLYGIGNVLSGFAVSSVGGLFASGLSYGIGASLMYTMSNSLPVQWFNSKLGTANGRIKMGGGIGATVMAIVCEVLADKLGIAWTFRIMGILSLATGIPAAFLIKERLLAHGNYAIDWSIFRNWAFSLLFMAGAVGVFAIYGPLFFLPYVANSLGFSNTTVAGVMTCFNACMAIGRLGSGVACDRFGTMNFLFLTMALNAVTMFAIWSVSSTLAILLVFAILNGVANGAFFVAMLTAIARVTGECHAAGALSMDLTGWSPGLLVGNPFAGVLDICYGCRSSELHRSLPTCYLLCWSSDFKYLEY
ncbi:putative Major facilitator superfamily (MFS) profile domain-containing protein [Seiridium cardinale]